MVEENDVRKGKEGDGGRECGAEGERRVWHGREKEEWVAKRVWCGREKM